MDVCATTFTPEQVNEFLAQEGLTEDNPCFFIERGRRYLAQHGKFVENACWDGGPQRIFTEAELRHHIEGRGSIDPTEKFSLHNILERYFVCFEGYHIPRWISEEEAEVARSTILKRLEQPQAEPVAVD